MSSKNHVYTVELRIYGKKLDPAIVTRETGLKPCQTRVAGSVYAGRTYDDAMWAYDGGKAFDFEFLEDGIAFVLDSLGAAADIISQYSNEHLVIWWCGHVQQSFDGGPRLSAKILQRMAALGAELYIDNYFSTPSVAGNDTASE